MSQYIDLEAGENNNSNSDTDNGPSGPSSVINNNNSAAGQPKAKRGRKTGSGNKKLTTTLTKVMTGDTLNMAERSTFLDTPPGFSGAAAPDVGDGFEFAYDMPDSLGAKIKRKARIGSAKNNGNFFLFY